MSNYSIETLAVQGSYHPENGGSRVMPITQSTTFRYDTADEVADLFDLTAVGHMYTRISNPTFEGFEGKMALLEGGVAAMATSSGQAATTLAILTVCSAGDHVIVSNELYGGSFNLFKYTLKKLGIDFTFVDQKLPVEELQKFVQENTKVIFAESLSNPSCQVLNFEAFATLAQKNRIVFMVDNTFPTPYLCRPLELGAHIVIHSASKYIDGHATSLGGVIVDGGTFEFKDNPRYPDFNTPDPSYHGLVYTEAFGNVAYIVKCRVQLLRDLGTTISPFNAWLCNKGLETLAVRMDRHSSNALSLAEFLESHPAISWVHYPFLARNENYPLAKKYLKAGSGVLTFGVKGDKDSGKNFINKLKLAAICVHVADVRTSVLHPASMTHRQLSSDDLIACGVSEDLIRCSVGIENIDDIIADFKQALES